VIAAITGLQGVGKTALAVALVHDPDMIDYFRDGILWANLGPEANVIRELHRWASVLKLPENQVEGLHTAEQWGRALRQAIGGRRILLVLDDIWQVDAALALQVGGPRCASLITTRSPSIAARVAFGDVVPLLVNLLASWL